MASESRVYLLQRGTTELYVYVMFVQINSIIGFPFSVATLMYNEQHEFTFGLGKYLRKINVYFHKTEFNSK